MFRAVYPIQGRFPWRNRGRSDDDRIVRRDEGRGDNGACVPRWFPFVNDASVSNGDPRAAVLVRSVSGRRKTRSGRGHFKCVPWVVGGQAIYGGYGGLVFREDVYRFQILNRGLLGREAKTFSGGVVNIGRRCRP